MHEYKVKVRLINRIVIVNVTARDAAQAKDIVRRQMGPRACVLVADRAR